jgi:hypothetical protein
MAAKSIFRCCLQENSHIYRLLPSRAEMIGISATYFMIYIYQSSTKSNFTSKPDYKSVFFNLKKISAPSIETLEI